MMACNSRENNVNDNDIVQRVEAVEDSYQYTDTSSSETYSTSTQSNYAPSNSSVTRSVAFQNAFNLGRELGAQDARNGENNRRICAASYTDEWIQQQFIQGYELGYNEVMAARSYEPDYEDDDNYYYYEEDEYY